MFGGGFGSSGGAFGAPASSSSSFSFSSPFGAAPSPSPSPFGAPQSSATAFGGGFGTPQSSGSAFGGFGTPQSSASAFGGFGLPQSSGSAFGFGQPQSSASAFGFGAPQSSASAFGGFGTPQSSASAFGFGTPQSSASAFGFGQQPQSSASAFGGFGTPQQSSAGGFSFGGFVSGNTPGMFGSAQPQSSAGGFMGFGTPASQPQTQLAPATGSSGIQPSDPAAAAEIEAIAAAFGMSNDPARMRFTHLFLNVVDNPAARQRPPNVDALRWRQAVHRAGGEHNKHGLWPVPANGFGDLLARKAAQDQAIQEHGDRMKQAQRAVAELVRKQDILVHASMDKIRREHQALSARVLSLVRRIDMLESRSAGMLGLWDDSSAQATTAIARSLESLESQLAPAAPNGLQRRVDSLAAAAHLRAHVEPIETDEVQFSADDLTGAYDFLNSQAQAITRLQRVLVRVNRDVSILADTHAQHAY